ncbi:CRC domain-containing protein TSO1-like [Phragmites australis]|uniref:CRC domain-containing protein TSO1-like n=1 Tax=Phragmites australis TaxID=29695 RepID=UPI002D7917E3|nr:CRC domain-containing protein TSO1-like [Phragmites australis]
MDAPESPPAGPPSSAAVALYEDSPVFDFINSLSPIATLKPNSVPNAQPSDLPPVSSLFASPQVNPQKESELTIRDVYVQLSEEALDPNFQRSQIGTSSWIQLSGSTKIVSENRSRNYAADDIHVYCAGASEGIATNYGPTMLPGASQSQLVSNDYFFDTFKVPSDDTPMDNALSQHQCGMHRRSLFSEKVGASNMSVQSALNLHHARIGGDANLIPAGSPALALPGIGLHLNAVASIPKDIMPYDNPLLPPKHNSPMKSVVSGHELVPYSSEVDVHNQNDHSSQKTMPKADESGQEIHKKKRRKFQNSDAESCRSCSCKKSKCLKLYCACFAARVYCSEFCSCQGCLNNHTQEETVLCTRKRTESRNPLAFAPKVTRTCGSSQELVDDSNKTPASARHKRGCNCRKSFCLKKYCECFQSGVGCSISCRCESCKNSFGRREGVLLLTTEKMEQGEKQKSANSKEEKLEFEKQHVVGQSGFLPSTENLLTSPSIEPCRSSILLPSTCSKPPLSSTRCSSRLHNPQSPMKADVLLPRFDTYVAEMILGNGPSDIQEGDSSCTASVKIVSPNKKRISPLRVGTGLSPINRSGRKLFLKSIPSFPSLSGDVNSESQ